MGLIVKSRIREYVELNVGENFAEKLDGKIEDILKKAEERAKANGRKTIYARDL